MIYCGDAAAVLKALPDGCVNMCVTSPPYYALRDYGTEGQIGLEDRVEEYIDHLVTVFREVRRVLRNDGTLWVNIGDSYRAKILIGVPWLLAFALRADGWYLRQDIIWHKPNPMPEGVKDRCTKAHEYIFLLSKSQQYYFDYRAIQEPAKYAGDKRGERADSRRGTKMNSMSGTTGEKRNKRDVWSVPTQPYKGAHFAVFPEKLIEPCILAGCPVDGVVLDPFCGAGTAAVVAEKTGRRFIGVELNPEYVTLAQERIADARERTERSREQLNIFGQEELL